LSNLQQFVAKVSKLTTAAASFLKGRPREGQAWEGQAKGGHGLRQGKGMQGGRTVRQRGGQARGRGVQARGRAGNGDGRHGRKSNDDFYCQKR
jgi:hypothetical protein